MLVTDLNPSEYDDNTRYYLTKVPSVPLLQALEESQQTTALFFDAIPEKKQTFRYAEQKWTIKDILQHLIDVDRVFTYRALRFGRGDTTPLPGFEEDDYALSAHANDRSMTDLIEEFIAVKTGTLLLFKSLPADVLSNTGIASGNPISVRAAGFKLVGHDKHHREVIQERYLK